MTLKEALYGAALMTELGAALASASVRCTTYSPPNTHPLHTFFPFPTSPTYRGLCRVLRPSGLAGGADVAMDALAHALAIGGAYGLQFHTAVLTDLPRAPLDFHQQMEDYFGAKQPLFTGQGAAAPRFDLVNQDD